MTALAVDLQFFLRLFNVITIIIFRVEIHQNCNMIKTVEE